MQQREKVDLLNYERSFSYNTFLKYTNPFFSMMTELDVTPLYRYHKKGHKFNMLVNYCVWKTINQMSCFHYRIEKDGLFFYKDLTISIVFNTKKEQIAFGLITAVNFEDFEKQYEEKRRSIFESGESDLSPDEGVIWTSSFPWISLKSVTTIYDTNITIPQIAWDKMVKKGFKCKMNFLIAVHHSLMDGKDVGEFFINLQQEINRLKI